MAILQARVDCMVCTRPVYKTDTILVRTMDGKKYKCSQCYKQNGTVIVEKPDKQDFYCERCRYKFRSRAQCCPYCNKNDLVVAGQGVVSDLL